MPQMPYLVKIGNRGFNLEQVTNWVYTEGPEGPRSHRIVLYFAVDPGSDFEENFDIFHGADADALLAYLDDMSVDVLAHRADSLQRSRQLQATMLAAMGAES